MFNLTKLSLLWEWVGELKKNVATLITEVGPSGENLLPSRSTATTGQILKLTGENKIPAWADEYSYTPPAYSETEVNTGQKWIDGKDIYMKVLSSTFPADSSAVVAGNIGLHDEVIEISLSSKTSTNISYYVAGGLNNTVLENGDVICSTSITGLRQLPFCVIVRYTKPDPAPETRDDDTPEETEEKKTTRKKATK